MKEGKVFKRILAIALVVVMTITMMPFGVFATEDATEGTPCTHENARVPENKHEAVPAKCNEYGMKAYYLCPDCDQKIVYYSNVAKVETDEALRIDKIPHTEEIVAAVESTCSKTGLTEGKKCSVCQEIIVAQTVTEKKAHTEEVIPATPPSCTVAGTTAGKKCSVCNEIIDAPAVDPAIPHDVEGVEFTKYDNEYHTKKCKVCGVDTTYVKHTFGEPEQTKAPTCEGKGEMTSTCVCGAEKKTDIPATGHNWQAGYCNDCETSCDHDWNGNVCKICEYTCVNHQYNEANCQNEAICYICQNKVADKNPNKHVTEETYKKNEKEAKCYEPGYTGDEYYVCCNGLKKAGKEITVDHVYDTELSKKDNATHGKKCTNVGCSAFEAASVAEHEFEIFDETKPATCTEKGEAIFKCKDCGAVSEGELDKVPHQHATTVSKKDDNTHGKKCANCNDFIEIGNHDWDFVSAKTPATCTTDGVGNYKCKDCEATKEDKIDKLNHDTTGVAFEKIDDAKHGKKCKTCNNFVEEAEHAYTEVVASSTATCVTAGSETKKCVCGDTKTTTVPANDNHDWNAWTETLAATCTTDGSQERTCKRNGCTEKETAKIDKLGHDMDVVEAKAATCQATGNNKYYACDRCDKFFKDEAGTTETTVAAETLAKGEHNFAKYVYNVNSETCTKEGTETAKCANEGCDATHTRDKVGTMVAHTFKNYVSDGNATCIADGTKTAVCEMCREAKDTIADAGSKDVAPHKPDSTGRKCELCNAELVCTHTYSVEKIITKTPTCTKDGEKAIVCSKCHANKEGTVEVVPATGHDWSEGEITKTATCKNTGSMRYTCNNMCGETKTEEIPVAEHTYKEDITHATCTEDGYSTFTCTVCGSHYVDNAVKAYGHMFDTYFHDEGSATCYKDGTKTAECANGCGTKNTLDDPNTKTDHEMTDFTVITPATCTEDGEEEAKCFYFEHCGYSEIVPVDALGHDESAEFVESKAATCTEKGEKTKTCTRCPEIVATEEIPALGHDETAEFVVVKEATCTEKGEKTKTCTRCPEIVAKEEIPALGHDIAADYTIDVAATCTTEGSQSKHCSRCDYKDGVVAIPASGHDMKPGEGTTATCTEPGKAVFVCANGCGKVNEEANVPALGHDFAYVSDGNATCQADGTKTGKCIRCEETDTIADTGSMLDHTFGEPVIDKASEEKGGLVTTKCANCDYEEVEEIAMIDDFKLKYETVVYDGKYKRPSLTITDAEGAKLVKGEDYLLELPAKEDCVNAGTYTYKVTFIGNYEGEKELTYKIVPGKAAKIVSKDTKQTYITLKWSTVKGADGYRIYVQNSKGGWKKLATVKGTTTYKVKDLKAGTKYTFAVKAFMKGEDGETTIWATEFAEQAFKTLPGKTSNLTAKTSKNAVKLTWKAVTGAEGYRVYVKTAKGGWKTVATVKGGKVTYTVKDLKPNTTYEYAVKAFYKDGSATVWSNQYKTVKAKTAAK